ncbi:hypothetical protein AC578_1655 [Pseudocercospora eumusae]|uniref:Uncharacterized protein n=1 Tax=Pseudocercospora eumusae TaxID=321146 RepID=A0A139HLR1_9PEZI|nr:hypothetical protein AC578_1655 [Pseudocercospora eumusae]
MDSMIYTFDSLRIGLGHFVDEAARVKFSPDVLVVASMTIKYPSGEDGCIVPGTRLTVLDFDATTQQYRVFATFPFDWAWATNTALLTCTRPTDEVVDRIGPEGESPEHTSLWDEDEDELYAITPTKAKVRPTANQQPKPTSLCINKRPAEDAVNGLTKRARDAQDSTADGFASAPVCDTIEDHMAAQWAAFEREEQHQAALERDFVSSVPIRKY